MSDTGHFEDCKIQIHWLFQMQLSVAHSSLRDPHNPSQQRTTHNTKNTFFLMKISKCVKATDSQNLLQIPFFKTRICMILFRFLIFTLYDLPDDNAVYLPVYNNLNCTSPVSFLTHIWSYQVSVLSHHPMESISNPFDPANGNTD